MDIRIKRKKTLLAMLLVVSVIFSACGKQETASTDTDDINELKAQIESLAVENEELSSSWRSLLRKKVSLQKRKWCRLRKPCRRKKRSRRRSLRKTD